MGSTWMPGSFTLCGKDLLEKGLREEEFIDRLPFWGEPYLSRLIPPTSIISHHGERSVYYPRRSADTAAVQTEEFIAGIPRGRSYETLMWTSEEAKPCAFLHQSRCMIYGVGDDTSLDACSHFLCMTGFVVLVLRHLSIIDAKQIVAWPMTHLNNIAVEALLALAGRSTQIRRLPDSGGGCTRQSGPPSLRRRQGADRHAKRGSESTVCLGPNTIPL